MKRNPLLLTILALIVLLSLMLASLASCGSEGPEATPTPTKTPKIEAAAATATPLPPTATPEPPTATPEPPTPTPEPPTATPEPQVELPAPLLVAGEIVVARSEANAGAAEVGALQKDDVVEGLERSADGQWIRICCVAGSEAWVESAALMPVPEGMVIEPAPSAFAELTTDGVNARKGPGTGYGKIGQVYTGEPLEVRGKNAEGTWYQLCCINGNEAWVSADFLALSGETASIPVVEAPELTAENRADTSTPSAAPGATGFVAIGNVVPAVDTPPSGKYLGLCGLNVNRPPREVPPSRPAISGNINPLTGQATDPALLQRRILAVRYGNEPAITGYYGLSSAELVFEELMDSLNTTRFTALFLANDAPMLGPLRSYRSTSIQVAQMYDAALASSGAVGPNQVFAYQAGLDDIDWRCNDPAYFLNPNAPSSDYQNRAVSSIAKLRSFIESRGFDRPATAPSFAFSDTPPQGRSGVSAVIPYVNRGFYEVEWRYDAASGKYLRFQGTARRPFSDANNGQQIAASNVVIMTVEHALTDLIEDSVGSRSVRTYIVGRQGPAVILRDGVAVDGFWRVNEKFNGMELVDGGGNPIPLKPGQTWFQIVPTTYNVTIAG